MSQEAVEQVLGRLLTDERFRRQAADSLEAACRQEGYRLIQGELQLLSGLDLRLMADLAGRFSRGLLRAGDGT